jgi:predicted transposase/invertase (TIGR01784 family)
LDQTLFPQATPYHLSFRLRCDQADIVFSDDLEFHTLELPKFSLSSHNAKTLTPIEQWAFLLKYAAEWDAEELTKILVEPPLSEAVGVLTMIAKSPDERRRYEERLKAQRDERARLSYALKEGREAGILIGQAKLLQQLLGEPPTSDDELFARPLPELSDLVTQLKSRLEKPQK